MVFVVIVDVVVVVEYGEIVENVWAWSGFDKIVFIEIDSGFDWFVGCSLVILF